MRHLGQGSPELDNPSISGYLNQPPTMAPVERKAQVRDFPFPARLANQKNALARCPDHTTSEGTYQASWW
jgi:hypothetical protein